MSQKPNFKIIYPKNIDGILITTEELFEEALKEAKSDNISFEYSEDEMLEISKNPEVGDVIENINRTYVLVTQDINFE